MAADTKAAAAPAQVKGPPPGLINLSQRYPQYEPGIDTRDVKKNFGKFGNIIHGTLLGQLSMPETIEDEATGAKRPWNVLVIELKQECAAKYQNPENPDMVDVKTAKVGERIILTKTAVIESMNLRGLDDALNDHEHVYEIYIKPQAGATRDRSRSLWQYPEFLIGNKVRRKPDQMVSLAAPKAAAAALPAGNSRVPFDVGQEAARS